jgi:hypothetical protein
MDTLQPFAIALFLSVVANRLVEALIVPLFERLKIDRFYLLYVAWGIAAIIVGLSGVNLFVGYITSPIGGQILTAIVAGGGANFIADLFNRPTSAPVETPTKP